MVQAAPRPKDPSPPKITPGFLSQRTASMKQRSRRWNGSKILNRLSDCNLLLRFTMAHPNSNQRQAHIEKILADSGELSVSKKKELATLPGCSYTTIHSDIAVVQGLRPWDKYRSTHQVATQNSRAKNLGLSGRLITEEWESLCSDFGNVCLSCGKPLPLVIDHITPLSQGGDNVIGNTQPLCQGCNLEKGVQTIDYRNK